MGTKLTTVEVFERALVMSVDERAELAAQLLNSLENAGERSSSEQIRARFLALDARFCVAVTAEIAVVGDDLDEPFGGPHLA